MDIYGWPHETFFETNRDVYGIGDPTEVPAFAWLYQAGARTALGFADHEDPEPRHVADLINDAGQVAGSTAWVHENGESVSAWLYSAGATIEMLLADGEHVAPNGLRDSVPAALNEQGQVAGTATRYDEDARANGASCWFYSAGVTNKIGLFGVEQTTDDEVKWCWISAMNNAGQVAGRSTRYPPESVSLVIESDDEITEYGANFYKRVLRVVVPGIAAP